MKKLSEVTVQEVLAGFDFDRASEIVGVPARELRAVAETHLLGLSWSYRDEEREAGASARRGRYLEARLTWDEGLMPYSVELRLIPFVSSAYIC